MVLCLGVGFSSSCLLDDAGNGLVLVGVAAWESSVSSAEAPVDYTCSEELVIARAGLFTEQQDNAVFAERPLSPFDSHCVMVANQLTVAEGFTVAAQTSSLQSDSKDVLTTGYEYCYAFENDAAVVAFDSVPEGSKLIDCDEVTAADRGFIPHTQLLPAGSLTRLGLSLLPQATIPLDGRRLVGAIRMHGKLANGSQIRSNWLNVSVFVEPILPCSATCTDSISTVLVTDGEKQVCAEVSCTEPGQSAQP